MMKAKVIKRVLASLLLVATMATVSGSVIAAPPNPKEYAQKIFK